MFIRLVKAGFIFPTLIKYHFPMQIKHLFLSALFLLAFTWTSCKKDDPDPQVTGQQIIPGQGLTDIKIGDAAQKAIDMYGSTAPSFGSSGGQYSHFLIFSSAGVTVYCEQTTQPTFNAQMKIKSFTLSAPFSGKTAKEIGIGSTKTDVKAAYGEPTSSSQFFGDDYAIGISFIYNDAGTTVEQIEVE